MVSSNHAKFHAFENHNLTIIIYIKLILSFSQVNEISWNNTNDSFFLTNGHGCINILRLERTANYPLKRHYGGTQLIWSTMGQKNVAIIKS